MRLAATTPMITPGRRQFDLETPPIKDEVRRCASLVPSGNAIKLLKLGDREDYDDHSDNHAYDSRP